MRQDSGDAHPSPLLGRSTRSSFPRARGQTAVPVTQGTAVAGKPSPRSQYRAGGGVTGFPLCKFWLAQGNTYHPCLIISQRQKL